MDKNSLAQLRLRTGKSQVHVAFELKLDPSTIGNWERGQSVPRFRNLRELAKCLDAYQCTYEEFANAFEQARVELSTMEILMLLKKIDSTFEEVICGSTIRQQDKD